MPCTFGTHSSAINDPTQSQDEANLTFGIRRGGKGKEGMEITDPFFDASLARDLEGAAYFSFGACHTSHSHFGDFLAVFVVLFGGAFFGFFGGRLSRRDVALSVH